ncbi:MAG: hypothetical protein PHD06_01935 [Bacteroidales bacterium]|jgi:predicted RNA-binding Zn-ribbon protein involved in translation (DUF1610 family)|nr:hypothetical protein [Bacteroidales bacterium]MDD4383920.1 hypothetical protein [Bacteroidales bacterium]MDY0198044.1 hypothetical protein [Tenuifilaceae bacterium]
MKGERAMKTNFFCPKCQGYLSVADKVVFAIKKKGLDGGLLLLSPNLGEYTYEYHPSIELIEGEEIDFFCPMCGYDLTLEGVKKLARVKMQIDDKETFWVVFSKKKGERCTYKISDGGEKESFGEHSGLNIDILSINLLK